MIPRLVLLALVLALSACGFQLRDALMLPPDLGPVRVNAADRYSPLARSLARALTRAGAVPATPDTVDPTVLDLLVERWGDTPISVDAFGRAQEFSLRYAVVFEMRKGDGTIVVPRQSIELSRDYISVPTSSIGTAGEREILMQELQRAMTSAVLRRIDAVTRRQASDADGDGAQQGVAPVPPGTAMQTPSEASAQMPAPQPAATAENGKDDANGKKAGDASADPPR